MLQHETPAQTSSLQTYGLLTVLTLILWITGYVEYCRNVLKLNAGELKRLLIEAWFGIQQNVANGEFTLMHVSKPKESILKHIGPTMLCCSTLSIICYETYIQLVFVSQLLTSHDF